MAAVIGAAVGNAATRPLHWIYRFSSLEVKIYEQTVYDKRDIWYKFALKDLGFGI